MCDIDFGGCRPVDECPGAPPMCSSGASLQCTGAPVYTRVSCDRGCDPATGLCRGRRFRPSNLGEGAFLDSAPDLDVPDGNYELNTDTCRVTGGGAAIETMNGGMPACVWTVGNVQISGGTNIRVFGSLPLILIASGDVNLEGSIDLGAESNFPGAGGYFGGTRGQLDGFGDSAGAAGSQRPPTLGDGGGGGAGGLSDGGDGGNAGDPSDSPAQGGEGGPMLTTTGEPLIGGSGGGAGPGSEGLEGEGGAGGGAIQISALGTLNVQGTIRATGGGGGGGRVANRSNWSAGGGGGAGGMILLEAPRIEMQGTLSVAGGGGGGGVASSSTGETDGEDGPISGNARGGQRGTPGGAGGDEVPEGGSSSGNQNGNGGGGGGAAGIVIVRGETLTLEGDLNPAVRPIQRPL